MADLAVVIPAYKKIFFDEALRSLANQSNKNFTVYIGDDCSPDDLKSICDKYSKALNLCYHRFDKNIVARLLVRQWERCVELVKDENWIWLFSDDDVADKDCVETFYKTIENDSCQFDVYRFNTRIINDQGLFISEAQESPFIENSYNMAIAILRGERGNSMPDHIFSKTIYKKKGFVFTYFAQSADWATSIFFSEEKGICTMGPAKVNWRLGAFNISGMASKKKVDMLKGYFQFLHWILNHFKYMQLTEKEKYNALAEMADYNLRQLIHLHYKGLPIKNFANVYRYYRIMKNVTLSLFSTLKLYWNLSHI
jgi:glycosyltransferase involved in cell wall biosynthesis